MDKDLVFKEMQAEGYPEFMTASIIKKIENFAAPINDALVILLSGSTPNIEIEGFSFNQLVETYGMKSIGALITLDWLIRDPRTAKESLSKKIK